MICLVQNIASAEEEIPKGEGYIKNTMIDFDSQKNWGNLPPPRRSPQSGEGMQKPQMSEACMAIVEELKSLIQERRQKRKSLKESGEMPERGADGKWIFTEEQKAEMVAMKAKMDDIKLRMQENDCPKRKRGRRRFGKRGAKNFQGGEGLPMGVPDLSNGLEGFKKVEENVQY